MSRDWSRSDDGSRASEFSKPLGPPKGPALESGDVWTREFAHASVYINISNRSASRIDWSPPGSPQRNATFSVKTDDHPATHQPSAKTGPAFGYSWDRLSTYAFPGDLNQRNFSDAEVAHFANFTLLLFWGVDLEPEPGRGAHWFVPDQEAKSLAQAAKFKAANPDVLLFPYITCVC